MTKARDNATQGGLTLVTKNSFTAASSVSIDNLEYNSKYKINCRIANSSGPNYNYILLRNNGSDLGGYSGACFYAMYNGPTGLESNWNNSSPLFFGYADVKFSFELHTGVSGGNAGLVGSTLFGDIYDANYGRAKFFGVETYNPSNGFRFYPNSGTITGTVEVYKYKN